MERNDGDAARAVTALDGLGLTYSIVRTRPASSAAESAELQSIELSQLLKTIVVRAGEGRYLFVLVPGDRSIEWKKLRRHLGVSRASLPQREEAEEVTGYRVGTITPFGSATALPVVLDAAGLGHPIVALGAGAPGTNIHVSPTELVEKLGAEVVDVASPLPA